VKLMNRRILLIGGLFLFVSVVGLLLSNWRHDASQGAGEAEEGVEIRHIAKPAGGVSGGTATHYPEGAMVPAQEGIRGSRARNPVDLFEEWMASLSRKDATDSGAIAQALGELLRGNPHGNDEFYRRVRRVFFDSSTSPRTRQELVRLLDRAATPAAAQFLLELAQQDLPPSLRQTLLSALSSIGDYYWDKGFRSELTPMLLEAWLQAQDPPLLEALAAAMAKTAVPEGINQLLDTVLARGKTLLEIQRSRDPRVSAAWSALESLQNPDVIPILASHLPQDAAGTTEAVICAGLLASMGRIEATEALLSWARGAGDSCASLIRDVFAKIQTFEALEFLRAAMAQNQSFKSGYVRQAILSALKKN